MSVTVKLRIVFSTLLTLVIAAAVVGWFMGKDPTQLGPVIGWVAASVGVGEASAIGKRATFNKEA